MKINGVAIIAAVSLDRKDFLESFLNFVSNFSIAKFWRIVTITLAAN